MNKVILMGRLAADPEIKYTQTGKAVANFRLAVNRRLSKEGAGKQPTADFFTIIAWQKLGEICGDYLNKGSQVLVEGRIQNSSYEKDGIKHYRTDIVATEIEFCGSKSNGKSGNSKQPSNITDGLGEDMDPNEDVPF